MLSVLTNESMSTSYDSSSLLSFSSGGASTCIGSIIAPAWGFRKERLNIKREIQSLFDYCDTDCRIKSLHTWIDLNDAIFLII